MDYKVIMASNSAELSIEVSRFLAEHQDFKLQGGPYTEANAVCQAVYKSEGKQMLLG